MKLTRDDIIFNKQIIEYKIEAEIKDIFTLKDYLKNSDFLPEIEQDVVWIILLDGIEYGYYRPKQNKYSMRGVDLCQVTQIHFKFYKNTEKRAFFIFKENGGSKLEMFQKSNSCFWEYMDYHISTDLEQIWCQELKIDSKKIEQSIKDNLEENRQLLKLILKRPKMFVGENRLDYIKMFYDGYQYGKKSIWDFDYDLQNWIFRKESVIIRSFNINIWTLFYRYYGIAEEAISKILEFIENTSLTSKIQTEYKNLKTIYSKVYKEEIILEKQQKEKKGFIKEKGFTKKKQYQLFISFLQKLIKEEYQKLFIYLYSEDLIMQIRFCYQTKENKWVDSSSLQNNTELEEKLIQLYGLFSYLTGGKDYKNYLFRIITLKVINGQIIKEVEKCKKYNNNTNYLFQPKEYKKMKSKSLQKQYDNWKEKIQEINS